MTFFRTLKYILNHPFNRNARFAGVFRFLRWQVRGLVVSGPVILSWTEHAKLLVRKGMTGATGNLYCGLLEFEDMAFLLHFLRAQDTFYDIGANVGAYTVLASAEIGASSVSFEPVPQAFSTLQENVRVNHMADLVQLFNQAVGSKQGTVSFTQSLDTVNHVASASEVDAISVEIRSLDSLQLPLPRLMKIDVEGYETEVIAGAEQLLAQPALQAIIIELNGSGGRYGYDEQKIHEKLLSYGFAPFVYDPPKRELSKVETFGSFNTIYIRDVEFTRERVRSGRRVKVLGRWV